MTISYQVNALNFPFKSYQTAIFDQAGYNELMVGASLSIQDSTIIYSRSENIGRKESKYQSGGPLSSSDCTSYTDEYSLIVRDLPGKHHDAFHFAVKENERDKNGTNLWNGAEFSGMGKKTGQIETVKLDEIDFNHDGNTDYIYSLWQGGAVIAGYAIISTQAEHKLLWAAGESACQLR